MLESAGFQVTVPWEPLCCGRPLYDYGMLDQARRQLREILDTLREEIREGVPVIGLEPSCLYSLRDEFTVLMKGAEGLAKNAFLLEEFLAQNPGRLSFGKLEQEVLLHGHCNQKAFDGMPAVQKVLGMVPGLKVQTVETSCCGMAGSFGYEAEHAEVSMKMAEVSLLPAVRNAPEAMLVADGTSCRHQILDGTGRKPVHVARLLESALSGR